MGNLVLCMTVRLVLLHCIGCVVNCKYSNVSMFPLVTIDCWSCGMEAKDKKSLTTKEWAKVEGLSIREVECHMDVDMFLDRYFKWEVGSPHCSVILYGMFVHATE